MFNWLLVFMPEITVNELERRRIKYALLVMAGLFVFFLAVLISHSVSHLHMIHFVADGLGLLGSGFAIFLVKNNKLEQALKIILLTLLVVVLIYGPGVDWVEPGGVVFLRLYVTLFALEAALLLIVSFYIKILNFIYLAILFTGYLVFHFIVIMYKNGWDSLIPINASYAVIAVLAINISCFIASLMLRYNIALIDKINADNQTVYESNIKLEAEVHNRTQALQESNNNLKQFAHIISHELKEPLRTLSGFSNLLQKKLKTLDINDSELNEYATFIQNGSGHMAKLVNEMLTFSSVQQSAKKMSEIDMNELVTLVTNQIDNLIQESKAVITTAALPNAYGESLLIFQLMQNLIVNAIKYQAPGSIPRISITGFKKANGVVYAVKDNGIGIPESALEDVFTPLVRLNPENFGDGTGLGLSICKKIVEAHGGTIKVESKENEGATFTFTLAQHFPS